MDCLDGIIHFKLMNMDLKLEHIHFITAANETQNHFDVAKKACEAGVKWIQYRNKLPYSKSTLDEAMKLKFLCKEYNATFIINDNPELAFEVKSDGVHLGKEDISIQDARNILGENFLIGASCNTTDDIDLAQMNGANYVGLGPFRFTNTKTNLNPVLGENGFKQIMLEYSNRNLSVPVFAIGGICADDIDFLNSIGIYGVAVSSVLANSSDTKASFNLLNEKFLIKKNITA